MLLKSLRAHFRQLYDSSELKFVGICTSNESSDLEVTDRLAADVMARLKVQPQVEYH